MKLLTDEQRKAWLYCAAGTLAVLTVFAAFFRPEGAWPLVALSVACIVFANIDKIGDFKASGAGIEVSLVRKAETAVDEISQLASRIGDVETRIQALVVDLDDKTTDLAGHITGGESYPCVKIIPGRALLLQVAGKHSLRELNVRLVDAAVADPMSTPGVYFDVPYIAAGTFRLRPIALFDKLANPMTGG
jgi:hypothetical protein